MKKNRMIDDTPEKENPYLKQVSGTHYMYMEIQPAEFINKIHYLEMIKERDYSEK